MEPAVYSASRYGSFFKYKHQRSTYSRGGSERLSIIHTVICLQAPDFALRLCRLWMCQ